MINFRINVWSKSMLGVTSSKKSCMIEVMFTIIEFLYLVCNVELFFSFLKNKTYGLWKCQKVIEAQNYLLDNIYSRFGSELYIQNVGITTGTNCAPCCCFYFAMRETSCSLSQRRNEIT